MSTPNASALDGVVIRTEHLSREAEGKLIVADVSLEVWHGELLGVVGASGSGKSSLLRLLNRLDEPTGGMVVVEGKDWRQIPPRELRRRIGMVTQRPFLFPGSVASNVGFGPRQRGVTLPESDIELLLERVGLPGFSARDVVHLSGGEQQRVSLARALANQPEVLLLDEPTSALDEVSKFGVEELIRGLVSSTSLTCVLVTHDREQARRICDRAALMEVGHLIQSGTPMEVLGA